MSGEERIEGGPGLFTAPPLEVGRKSIEAVLGQKLVRADVLILSSQLQAGQPVDEILEDVVDGMLFTFESGELGIHWASPGKWGAAETAVDYCLAALPGELSGSVWEKGCLSTIDVSGFGPFRGLVGGRLISAEMFGWSQVPQGLVLRSAAGSVGIVLGVFGRKVFGDADDVLVVTPTEVRHGGRLPVDEPWDSLIRLSVE